MTKDTFIENQEVKAIIKELKNQKIQEKQFSDVLDKDNNQYVELVMEGGGILGVALVGYCYVLEQMGIRFFSLAGTSAGSINAMLLASGGTISETKTENNIEILANQNLYDFVDGKNVKKLLDNFLSKSNRLQLIFEIFKVLNPLLKKLGINPGDKFLEWMSQVLENNGIKTTEDLLAKFKELPNGLKIRDGIDKTLEGLEPKLALITSDITTETKVDFPRMRDLYWEDADRINPANYVRASMSIPYFYEPFTVEHLPQHIGARESWREMAGYVGIVPGKVYFVDGGVMSNFPINIFHNYNNVPRMPTFGVRFGSYRTGTNKITNPLNFFYSMFKSIRYLYDYDFILKNPDYQMLIQHIDIGNHNWLNFALTDNDKVDLFVRGAKAAELFLRKFEWEKYKNRREKLIMK